MFRTHQPSWQGGFDQFLQWGWCNRNEQAFWLRQQVLARPISSPLREASLIVFTRKPIETALVQELRPDVPGKSSADWLQQQQNVESGSFWTERNDQSQGRLFTSHGSAQWQLERRVDDSSASLLSGLFDAASAQSCYFDGQLTAAGLTVSGVFTGAMAQRWGKAVAPGFVQVQAQNFQQNEDVKLFAYGHTLASQWQSREPLALSFAHLKIGQEQHVFDRWLPALTVDAPRLDSFRWQASFVNKTYRLELIVDGGNPRLVPWAAMNERLPLGGRRVIKMTPFANLTLTLFKRGETQALKTFKSNQAWLTTAMPGSEVRSRGPVAQA
ncbi:MAG: hypothetical protein U0998_06510 [Moraxellaceae bacterium]|nr:hypothetical protein [Moraxellaceae bacterium]MDZ4386853.1 hypothetical protein [Moraxellaceae bacterium]